MAFTLRDITEGLFKNGYAWTGHPSKDKALVWAKTACVQPGGASALAAAGAIPITHSVCVTTIAGTYAWTLANGTAGQELVVTLGTATSGAGTITPVTATGWATAVFTVVGDGLSLRYVDDTVGWIVTGSYGTTSSTAATVITL